MESSLKCNNLEMDSKKYTCCNGYINKGFNLSCCGTSSYNSMKSSCCQDVVTDDLSQRVSECCGNRAYNPLNQICCGESIVNKNSPQSVCCGSVAFEERTQLCCGSGRVIHNKTSKKDLCCGNKTYNSMTHCCTADLEIKNCSQSKTEGPCNKTGGHSQNQNGTNQTDKATDSKGSSAPHCASLKNDRICCAGNTLLKKSGLTRCCGDKAYELSDENTLCCDGQLYFNLSADAKCTGNATFSPHKYTVCQNHVSLPPGQQCCGKNTFDPQKEICCNGHRHAKHLNNTSCCGFHAYNSHQQKCCSGHLHTPSSTDVECCGTLLLTNRTAHHCCRSADMSLIYNILPNHHCCGHLYYNSQLWSCCSEKLIPFKSSHKKIQEKSFRPLTDLITSHICTSRVLLGKLQSESVMASKRVLVLNNMLEIHNTTITAKEDPFVIELHDHCLFPSLTLGHTYLWTPSNGTYEPLSEITDLLFSLHSLFTQCS